MNKALRGNVLRGEQGVKRLTLLDFGAKNSLNLKVIFEGFFKKGDILCCHRHPKSDR